MVVHHIPQTRQLRLDQELRGVELYELRLEDDVDRGGEVAGVVVELSEEDYGEPLSLR